ncbi:NEP1-interacting protein 2-like isoform X2 [Zingiber officinale]|uniref:NEP1-interacting protein 2-like isoform X2 n=1 Tax=Zingiber officinale TaxID=94328 RepID=UPI001C4C1F4A|nr:NEP1-interacting protein 2-like isoform X2 [Zingiber officinale]
MDFPSSSSSSSSSSGRESFSYRSMVSKLLARVICVTLTCAITIGAIAGALIGIATESGFLRGSGIGAISGAVFSIEVVESSLDLWNSSESGIWSLLYLLDIVSSIVSGRLVREKVGPAVQSAIQSQMSALNLPFIESLDLFETGGAKRRLPLEEVEKLPKCKTTAKDSVDASGERRSCAVCLQEVEVGDMARRLPICQHMFHLPCIDSWLVRQASCPLCRTDII